MEDFLTGWKMMTNRILGRKSAINIKPIILIILIIIKGLINGD